MELWKNKYLDVNIYTRPGKRIKKVRKIVIHDTANPGANAYNHYRYFNTTARQSKRYASAHIFVDQQEAICIIPLNEIAYHANDGLIRKIQVLKPNANDYSIGIELCLTKEGRICGRTLARSAEIVAFLCKKYKLTEKDVVRHYDVTNKRCPKAWVANESLYTAFLRQVKQRLKASYVKK